MKATVTSQPKGNIRANRKESHFTNEYTVITSDLKTPIVLRIYSTQSRNYACIWIHAEPVHLSGGGYASGYGYHRPSEATGKAIANAGITLDQDINGHGENAMHEALGAIAKMLGIKKFIIHEAHA